MARKNADATCLFCDESPCVCNGPVKSKTKRKTKSEPKQPTSTSTQSDSFDFVPEPVKRFKNKTTVKHQPDVNLEVAAGNLKDAGILHPDSIAELESDGVLVRRMQRDTINRLVEWRQLRGNASRMD